MIKRIALGLGLLLVVLGLAIPTHDSFAAETPSVSSATLAKTTITKTSGLTKTAKLKEGQLIAKIRIPRFGSKYERGIYEGVSVPQVSNTLGIGHYPETQLPGEEGNMAIAGHRFGNGGPMLKIDQFQPGDHVKVETADAIYTYKWLQTKIVLPKEVGVIHRVPVGLKDPQKNGHYLTLTSCTPVHINTHRIIAWFSLEKTEPKN